MTLLKYQTTTQLYLTKQILCNKRVPWHFSNIFPFLYLDWHCTCDMGLPWQRLGLWRHRKCEVSWDQQRLKKHPSSEPAKSSTQDAQRCLHRGFRQWQGKRMVINNYRSNRNNHSSHRKQVKPYPQLKSLKYKEEHQYLLNTGVYTAHFKENNYIEVKVVSQKMISIQT